MKHTCTVYNQYVVQLLSKYNYSHVKTRVGQGPRVFFGPYKVSVANLLNYLV